MLEEDTSFQIREKGLPYSSDMSTIFLVSFAPEYAKGHCKGPDGCCAHSEPASQARVTELGDLVFITRGQQACSLS